MPTSLSPFQLWFLKAVFYWQKYPGPEIATKHVKGGGFVGVFCLNKRPGVPLAFIEAEFPVKDSALGPPLNSSGFKQLPYWAEIDEIVHSGLVFKEMVHLKDSKTDELPFLVELAYKTSAGNLARISEKSIPGWGRKREMYLVVNVMGAKAPFQMPAAVPSPYFFVTPRGVRLLGRSNSSRNRPDEPKDELIEPNVFRFQGKSIELQPQSWKIMKLVWECKKPVSLQLLAENVWDRPDTRPKTITNAVYKLNRQLCDGNCSIQFSIKDEYVIQDSAK